ncbi:alpha-amylase family glycosyl hydrolase [Deinococcus budaensis]|uniref:Glycosidase n=1 Tax=Deinococcus budaensis TaxID=1665626 RepID=A0A7W8GDM0_9DEIO|nr:alpha-amylase family glycosyl hydrolase [Deinococcus budaensis]MBB5233606.1 glycosidase [Deinococcus budaensis]
MKRFQKVGRLSALAALTLSLSACGVFQAPGRAPGPGTDVRDWRDEVIYFAMTDRFANGDPSNDNGAARGAGDHADRSNPLGWHGGDFAGLKAKIEEGYFKKMGFTALWISPVVLQVPAIVAQDKVNKGQLFAGYHGYWAEDFFQTDPHFGTLAEYKALVNVAHKNGLKIIQDIVVNHAGYGATLTKTNPEWFHTEAECQASPNPVVDCPLAGLPDFKQEVPEVTQYLNRFVNHWRSETGIDGLRIDTMKHVPDSYWRQFFAAGGAGDPRKIWSVGEVFDGNPAYLARFMDELGSPSVFDFALYFALKDQVSSAGGDLGRVADVFAQDGAYRDPTRLTTFVDNHDVRRFVSEVTERGGSAEQARERLDLALSLIYTSRGTPSVYQGSEIAQPGLGDPYDYELGKGNREDMNFAALAQSTLDERLAALAAARAKYRVLTRGAQQELWRPNGGAPILAYRRVATDNRGGQPVVVVINNGDAPVDLATLTGGGIPLLGTFANTPIQEITGRVTNLGLSDGKLVGMVPARTALAITAQAGSAAGTVNPRLPEVSGLTARAGDGAAELRWTASTDAAVTGYRIYARTAGGQERLLNFAPLPKTQTTFLARGLPNDAETTFRVVTVDAQGAESRGASVKATPSARNTVKVSFTVDARSQGNGPIELRRFDTGSQVEYPMTQASRGLWKTDIELPLFREIKFKFGNDGPGAKNSGYEGPGQGDRSYVVGSGDGSYSGTYDFIDKPVPGATVEGRVTGAGTPLGGALVEATTADPALNYALTFADGTYTLFAPAGAHTLKASAEGYAPGTRQATAPATGVDFDLTRAASGGTVVGKYRVDGDLGDWTAPKVSVQSPAEGVFGADNNWLTLRADSDAQYLYLAYTYRVSGNKAVVYLDFKDGGAAQADRFEAWRQAATFSGGMGGVDAFIPRYENQNAELRLVQSDTATPAVDAGRYTVATAGTLPAQTVELAVPWSALGLSGAPAGGVNVVGGIFGGDGYGAGDIIPDAGSTPPGANTIGSDAEQRRATFTQPLNVK